jgi:hypothetical protein
MIDSLRSTKVKRNRQKTREENAAGGTAEGAQKGHIAVGLWRRDRSTGWLARWR